MNIFALSVIFTAVSPASCKVLRTYWISPSCPDRVGRHFQDAHADALDWVRRAALRLILGDHLQREYFERLFSPTNADFDTFRFTLAHYLGHPDLRSNIPGVSEIVPEPNNDRAMANYRYYCDNDPRHVNGNSRWKLRPDPIHPPQDYKPQRERPLAQDASRDEQYQEWQDRDNGIYMGSGAACGRPGLLAVTYRQRMPGPWRQPNRTTVTFCDELLNLSEDNHSWTFEEYVATHDITNTPRRLPPIEAFALLLPLQILHQVCAIKLLPSATLPGLTVPS
ncbi:MAG: hypothetical protein Q9227_004798 [Pyrenula ochraceoflavens]